MTEPIWHMIGDPLFGGAFRNLWPLLVMPALAALISDRTARLLPKTPEAWAPAALLSALPGLVALGAMVPLLYAGGEAMTAGQVADKTGLARPTVSTTLSKLAKSGEVQKAERGYRLAPTGEAPEAMPAASGE